VDFRRFMDALKRHDYRGWIVVEQDVLPSLGTPLASASRNRRHLRSLGV
jgi:inosose dehydratase